MNETTATLPVMTRQERNRAVLRAVALRCIERVTTLRLKGKKADEEAVAFFAGACGGIEAFAATGQFDPTYQAVGTALAYIVSVRGMIGVRQIAAENAPAAKVVS